MTDTNGHFVIVFNGEIYNYLELFKKLSSKGYEFHSDVGMKRKKPWYMP